MRITTLFSLVVLFLFAAVSGAQTQPPANFMPVEEIKPGMKGIIRTTLTGTKVEEYPAVVIGVLPDLIGPKSDLVLVRLEGDRMQFQGVAGGMSGSPFFIDGRLVGALAYRLGDFPKEPIAGVTPIKEMLTTQHGGRGGPKMTMDYYRLFSDSRAFKEVSARLGRTIPKPEINSSGRATAFTPLLSTIIHSGIPAETIKRFAPLFESAGWQVSAGGTVGQLRQPIEGDLQAGMPVAVPLIYGDLYYGASGTVTYVDGKKVYAFGHPFNQLGNVSYPMARAEMVTVLTSLAGANNLVNIGQVVGAITQDRATAIYGELGATANTFTLKVNVTYAGQPLDSYSYVIARDALFSPGLLALAVNSSLLITQGQLGEMSASIKGNIEIEGEDTVHMDDLYSGTSVVNDLSILPASVYYFIDNNEFHPIKVKNIELNIDLVEELKVATLERAWLTKNKVKAGDHFELVMELKPRRGKPVFYREQFYIPPTLQAGTYMITVGNGEAISQQENAMIKGEVKIRDLSQMIRLVNTLRANYKLYAQTFREEKGVYYEGDFFPGLPPSTLSVIHTNTGDENFVDLTGTVMDERQIETEYMVSGLRKLTFTVTR